MPQQLGIDKYVDALKVLEDMVKKMIPIKKTHFILDHQLDARFFTVLEELKIVELIESSKLAGFVFDWTYKKPDNVTSTHLAMLVTGEIYRLNQVAYEYYSSPDYKLKKAKKEHKEKEKQEREYKEQERLKAKTQSHTQTIVLDLPPQNQGNKYLQHQNTLVFRSHYPGN